MQTSRALTLSDVFMPQRALVRDALLVLGASVAIGLSAFVAIPLPFTPVPLTLQTLVVLLAGITLGRRRGVLAVLVYIAQGLAGLPVFAGGGVGMARLLGPTGGYLVGFVLAAGLVGWLAEKGWDRKVRSALGALALGTVVIHGAGALWLATFVGLPAALVQGVLPFLVGDAMKIAAATTTLPLAWRWVHRS